MLLWRARFDAVTGARRRRCLEFQLGADILRTAVAPMLREIGEVAAIAAIRTALNFFLAREIAQERAELAAADEAPGPGRGGGAVTTAMPTASVLLTMLRVTAGVVAALVSRDLRTGLSCPLDLWLGAGLLRLVGTPEWQSLVVAGVILAVRQVVNRAVRRSPVAVASPGRGSARREGGVSGAPS